MCTVTWAHQPGGYQIFCNRDERRSRGPALPPAARSLAGVRYVAPLDCDFGGSWIATNELGLTLCLLNGYHASDERRSASWISRGLLLTSLVACPAPNQVKERVADLDLSRYRTFLLAAFAPDGRHLLLRWESERLAVEDLRESRQPLVSSSFDTDEVRRRRAEHYRRLQLRHPGDPTRLHLAYHESHHPRPGPYSPCMHRSDARTVSFSWVRVDRMRASFRYAPHSPCQGLPTSEPVVLDRVSRERINGSTAELGGGR